MAARDPAVPGGQPARRGSPPRQAAPSTAAPGRRRSGDIEAPCYKTGSRYVAPDVALRIARLRPLVEQAGGPNGFVRLHPEVDRTYVSQLLNGLRPFGERAARKMEERCGLARLFFDAPRRSATDPDQAELDGIMTALSRSNRKALLDAARGLLAGQPPARRMAG